MSSQETRGSLYAILSGFLYGFLGYFGLNAIHSNLSESTMLFWRFLISSLVILIILIPQFKTINDSFKSMFVAYSTGILFYGVSTLVYFYSSHYIGSGLAMVIFFTYPVIIMILNYFLYRQLIPGVYYIAALILLIGMALLVDFNAVTIDLRGLFLGVLSAFFYACYIVSSKNNKISPQVSSFMVCLGCLTTSFVISCATGTFAVPNSLSVWLNLSGISIVATVIPILLMLSSLNYISSEKASMLSVLEPVFVVIFGVILLDEKLDVWNVLGICLVLSGALITLLSHKLSLKQMRYKLSQVSIVS